MENEQRERSTILIIDDDARLCRLIAEFFSDAEYDVQAVHHGAVGLAKALDESFDLILLDVMLPGMDGCEVLTQLRRRSSVPVIMLTARGAREDCVKGLNLGADDYLAKPFGPKSWLRGLPLFCAGLAGLRIGGPIRCRWVDCV